MPVLGDGRRSKSRTVNFESFIDEFSKWDTLNLPGNIKTGVLYLLMHAVRK